MGTRPSGYPEEEQQIQGVVSYRTGRGAGGSALLRDWGPACQTKGVQQLAEGMCHHPKCCIRSQTGHNGPGKMVKSRPRFLDVEAGYI